MIRNGRLRVFLATLALLLWQCSTAALWAQQAGAETAESPESGLPTFHEVVGLVWQAYVDPVDLEGLMLSAIDGVSDALDPFAVFVPRRQVDGFLHSREEARRLGGMVVLRERGILYAAVVFADGTAHRAGLRASDVITAIDGLPTRRMPRWKAVQLLAARLKDAQVEFELLRAGEKMKLTLDYTPSDAPAAEVEEVEGKSLLRIRRFDGSASSRVAAALEGLNQGSRPGLLVDLRGAEPADEEQAYRVGDLFADGGLGALRRHGETIRSFEGEEGTLWRGEIVVLVDRATLGPAEILASILRQKAKARLVGERTFGWAGRLNQITLSSGDALLLTDAFYTGPDGRLINQGLEPDVPVRRNGPFQTEDEDRILRAGLNLLKGD